MAAADMHVQCSCASPTPSLCSPLLQHQRIPRAQKDDIVLNSRGAIEALFDREVEHYSDQPGRSPT